MNTLSLNIENLQTICKKRVDIKEQLVEELPHYRHQVLYLHNDEITTGLLNNKIEIKINLLTGQLLYFHNEKGQYIDLIHTDIVICEKFLPKNSNSQILTKIFFENRLTLTQKTWFPKQEVFVT